MIDRTLAPAISDFTSLSIPELKSVTLPSGVDVHYLDNRDMDVYNIIILFDSGSLENHDMPAAARLTVPLAGEGSLMHPDGKLSELMGYHGMRVQTRTHDHHTEYSFGLLRDKLDKALPLIREYIFSPAFGEKSIEIYAENAAQSYLLNRQKVNYHSDKTMASHMFGSNHPKAVEITDSDYRAVKRDDIISVYDRILNSNISVYVAGVVDDAVLNKINSVFEDYRPSRMVTSEYKIFPYVGEGLGQRYDIHLEGKLQSSVNISLPAVPRIHPDYLLLRNLIIALGGYFGSRLVTNIREEKGLTYGISSALYGSPEGAYISIGSMTANENVDELISETMKEIERLSSELFGNEEFMMVRSYILSQLASMLDTPLNILQYYLSLKTAFIPHADYFKRQFETVKAMTPESLRDVAGRHLLGREWTVAVAGDI
ncbi:MAG: insulinase family protein [Muribaculum sp.]|nr:insulinase family protein [Muribaculum sp.]